MNDNWTEEEFIERLKTNPSLAKANSHSFNSKASRKPATPLYKPSMGKLPCREINTVILVEPTPKGRPRLTTVNGQARAFTPAKTRKAEDEIQYAIRQAFNGQSFDKDVPLKLEAIFYRTRPKSCKKPYPVQRPDLDNLTKLLLDSLNRFAFHDDSQIIDMTISKRFAIEMPKIEIRITEVN